MSKLISTSECWGLQFLRKKDFAVNEANARYLLQLSIIFLGQQPITTAFVVRETRLPRATVVRRLGQLVAEGKLTKTGDGVRTKYSLGGVKSW